MKHVSLVAVSSALLVLLLPTSALIAQVATDDLTGFCPQITRTLSRGMNDALTQGQVSELQVFLTHRYSLSEDALAGGYFGRLTQSYVQRFQQEQGIAMLGVVGPQTRAKIEQTCRTGNTQTQCPVYTQPQCPSGQQLIPGVRDSKGCLSQSVCRSVSSSQRGDFYATPEQGTVPLQVSFYAMVGGRAQYAVDFGDGTAPQAISCSALYGACVTPGTVSHTYNKSGTYQALLKRVYSMMELQPGDRIIGSLASIPIRVTEPQIQTPSVDAKCRVWFDGCNTCVRDSIQGVLGCTKMACLTMQNASCKEYFGTGKSDYPPFITGFSGPTQLDVNQDGFWRLDANDKEGQQLSYVIDWGEYNRTTQSATPTAFSQIATVAHRFAVAGTYTVSVTVFDTAGGVATSSGTVIVGTSTTTCTTEYRPVCGERRVCSASQTDCWNEKKTYGNVCSLRAENAFYLSEGECPRTTQTYTPSPLCKQWFDGCNTCTRSSADGVATCTLRACTQVTNGYCTGYFDSSIASLSGKSEGMTVTIAGPTELVQAMQKTGNAPCEYALDWGDGTAAPKSSVCSGELVHTYTKTGMFTIQATLYRPGTTTILWKSYIKPTLPSTATY